MPSEGHTQAHRLPVSVLWLLMSRELGNSPGLAAELLSSFPEARLLAEEGPGVELSLLLPVPAAVVATPFTLPVEVRLAF